MIKLVCPYCESDDIEWVKADFEGYDVLKCQGCGELLNLIAMKLEEVEK